MINRNQFQQLAKSFRAGRLSLEQFTSQVFASGTTESAPSVAGPGEPPTADAIPMLKLPSRRPDSHKGDYGKVLLIGGSMGMAGAIGLTAMAATRAGAGLVKVLVPDAIQSIVAGFSPCYMTRGCESRDGHFALSSLEAVEQELAWADVVAIGPGMGRGDAQQAMVQYVYEFASQPLIVDADGLNSLSDGGVELGQHAGPRILTPHDREFERVTGTSYGSRQTREDAAIGLAETHSIVVVLKGNRTLISNGKQLFHNQTGNPGMATGGTGDVLTGIIAALIGQAMSPLDAARLGVHLHGLAGDEAARRFGEVSLVASDLIGCTGDELKKLHN